MKSTYHITLHIKTPGGFESYGTFNLGKEKDKAEAIFSQLKGADDVSETSVLHMDFIEMRAGIPVSGKVLHCTLDDIATNARIITRDVFKNLALEGK